MKSMKTISESNEKSAGAAGGKRKAVLAALILLEILACVFDALWNDSRIIKPIHPDTYQFRATDLPLMVVTAALALYVVYLAVRTVFAAKKNRGGGGAQMTRKLNPRFGWFGFFGFFGFLGIPHYFYTHQVWPFFFFVFFGFFGFFYEGKMSGTLMDERFKREQERAQLVSYRMGFGLLWAVTWFSGMAGTKLDTEYIAILFTVASSLIIALVLFLSNYLLYRYDTEEDE